MELFFPFNGNLETVWNAWRRYCSLRGCVLRLDENRLAGLVAVMDDGTMTAYVHYLLVYPRYQGYGVGSWLPGI